MKRWTITYGFCIALGLFCAREARSQCATGFYTSGGNCVPNQTFPSEFGYDANQYPVCGSGRVAVSGDGNYTLSKAGYSTTIGGGVNYTDPSANVYQHLVSASSPPTFIIPQIARCVCTNTKADINLTDNNAPIGNYPATTSSNGARRFYPDTLDVINTQTYQNQVHYSPVAIDKDPTKDGRLYSEYVTNSASHCLCPNVNELPSPNDPNDPNSGSSCQPKIPILAAPSPAGQVGANYVVLPTYDSTVFSGHILKTSDEPTDAGSTVLSSFVLPNSSSDQTNTTQYNRKIWTCANPYMPALTGCKFDATIAAKHRCDDGTGGGPVSATAGGTFTNIVNKKLACCMNRFTTGDLFEKFDCIDNSAKSYADFNALWASADDASKGGQLNALLLMAGANAATTKGQVISGFYKLNGTRCNQFSEFAFPPGGGIQPYQVDPLIVSTQQAKVGAAPVVMGTPIPLPSGTAYSALNASITGTSKLSYPKTLLDYQTCPILVRAAMVATCPSAVDVPNALTSIVDPTDGTTVRCAAAGSIQIHVRIEQVYTISGQAPSKPFDTFLNPGQNESIDISKIILSKYGDQCPPGTSSLGGICVYQ